MSSFRLLLGIGRARKIPDRQYACFQASYRYRTVPANHSLMALILTSYLGHKRDTPYYRPFVLRTEFLTSLLIITLVLIALIEYACLVVPGHDGFGDLSSSIMNDSRQSLKLSPPWKSSQNSKFICLFDLS